MPSFDDAQQPALALGPGGLVALAMLQRGNITVALSKDGGASFSEPVVAMDCAGQARGGRQRGPRIGIDAQGTITVSAPVTFDAEERKKRYPAPELYLVQSHDGGKTFSAPLRVNLLEKKAPEGLHMLSVTPDGVAHLAWLDISARSGPGQDLYYARLVNGELTDRTTVARTVCECCAPGLGLDSKGNPTIAWREGGLKNSRELFLRRSLDGGKRFGTVQRINTSPTLETGCPMSLPTTVVSGDSRRVLVAWKHVNKSAPHVSWREATAPAPDADLQPQPGGTQDHPCLALAADGTWSAVWEETRGGRQSVWYRTAKNGDQGRQLSAPSDGQAAFPVLVVGAQTTVAYEAKQGTQLRVFVQKL